MRVFVAGGTGVLGRRLVPQLVARGHQVTATTTGEAKLALARELGAEGVVMDGLDAASVGEAVAKARPDVIVHQMTAINPLHAGKPDLKHPDRWFAATIRLRVEGTDHLLAAAEAAGAPHVVAQSYAGWNGIREGGWIKTEDDPLDPEKGTAGRLSAEAVRHVEEAVVGAGGAALRYGGLYGPVGDTGGRTPQWGGGVFGAENVARLLVSLAAPLARVGVVVERHLLNGEPGALLLDRDGRVLSALVVETIGGRIQTVRSVVNPDKLGHLGPVADAWALRREAPDVGPDVQG